MVWKLRISLPNPNTYFGKAPDGSATIGGYASEPKPAKDYFLAIHRMDVAEALESDFAGVAFIGGLSWRKDEARAVDPLVRMALSKHAVLGAICDATVYLSALGVLNDVDHTGNLLDDLQGYAGNRYTGMARYQQRQAVRDSHIVTANGTAGMDFAREMLVALGVMSEEEAGKWYRLFKNGFYEAMPEGRWWLERMAAAHG